MHSTVFLYHSLLPVLSFSPLSSFPFLSHLRSVGHILFSKIFLWYFTFSAIQLDNTVKMWNSFFLVNVLLLFGIKANPKGLLVFNHSEESCVPCAEPHPKSEQAWISLHNNLVWQNFFLNWKPRFTNNSLHYVDSCAIYSDFYQEFHCELLWWLVNENLFLRDCIP